MIKRILTYSLTFTLLSATWFGTLPKGRAAETDPAKDVIIGKTVQYLKERRINASDDKLRAIANSVYEESKRHDFDYRLVLAVMKVESNFQNDAISRRGARGLLQIQPALAKHIAKDAGVLVKGTSCLHEPEKNIKIGVNYLSKLMDMFENINTALHAYNVGPAKVKPHQKDDAAAVPQTRFAKKVMSEYRQIVEVLPDSED